MLVTKSTNIHIGLHILIGIEEPAKSVNQLRSILSSRIEQMENMILPFCLHHLHRSSPPALPQNVAVMQPVAPQHIFLRHTNHNSPAPQPPQTRILPRVDTRVIGPGRPGERKPPEPLHERSEVDAIGVGLYRHSAQEVRVHHNNPPQLHSSSAETRTSLYAEFQRHVVREITPRAVSRQVHAPAVGAWAQPLVGVAGGHPPEGGPRVVVCGGEGVFRG